MTDAGGPVTRAAGVPFVSAPARLLATAEQVGAAAAYHERGNTHWQPASCATYAEQVRCSARALVAIGVQPREVVCILGFNRPE